MGDCYSQKVRGAPGGAAERKKVACLRQIGLKELLETDLSIRRPDASAAARRLRGGVGGDPELGAEVPGSILSRDELERRSFGELSDSQQVITSLQVNSKTLPSNFNKRPLNSEQNVKKGNANQQALMKTDGTDTDGYSKLVKRKKQRVLDPAGSLYYHWSAVVSFAFLYNFWSLSYRFAFCEIDFDSMAFWFALDYSADIIYTLDVIVNHHTGYLEDGVLERNLDKIGQHYRDCTLFYLDCLCLLPLDVLYLSIGFNSILRCSRLVKIYKFWSYVDRTERHTNYPNVFRTFTLVHYILVIFHWNACLFHMISKNKLIDIEGLYRISDNRCHDILCQYLHAFYWSTLALTTIGDLPRPRTKGEYVYVTVELFFGLFLFASVLGHVANIVTNVSAARKEFQAKLDAVKTFMRMRRVSDELQNKVIRWFDYLWISQKSSDEERSVACLPDRLKAEIAIHVHLDTLKRVDIFQNTEAGFLCELVLRLKPVLFSPGDYVCRKNEVGHEMYIVSRGILEVVTNEGATVVATLKAGSYFGEISVLNVGLAGNKRTASVRSVGYSDLFCLNKQDLWDVLKNYPNAEARIRARAEERLSKLDINSSNANQQQQHYLRKPAQESSPFGGPPTHQAGSQSLSGNFNGASSRHRRRVCSSGSRQRLVGGQQLLQQGGHANCCSSGYKCAHEQVLGSCCCASYRQTLAGHHSNITARHLLELNLTRRDGNNGQPASSFAPANAGNNLTPPNDEQPLSFGSHSRSLDQATQSNIPESSENRLETNKRRHYQNSNQSREEDESHRLVGVSRNSSRDESPGGETRRLASNSPSDPFGPNRGRSRAAVLKRIGSADELGALRRRTIDGEDNDHTDTGIDSMRTPKAGQLDQAAAQIGSIQHLSSGSMDSSCCLQARPAGGREQRLAVCQHHSNQQAAYQDTCLAIPRYRLGGSRRNRRRRTNKHRCCLRAEEQSDEREPSLVGRLYRQPQTGLWWTNGQAFQANSTAPFLQVPLLAAQTADGSYQMLQPVMASAHQSVSMTQLDLHQQVPPTGASSTSKPSDGIQYRRQRPPVEAHLCSESALSFNGIDWHRSRTNEAQTSGYGDPVTITSGGQLAADAGGESPSSLSASVTSQRAHPPLQAAQSGLEGSRAMADAVVIDTE